MLTSDTILANEALKGLTEEQVSAITTLSRNDEDAVMAKRFGEVYREMDKSIETATGIKRDGDEKTYLYLERATKAFADKYADYDGLKEKISDLETKLAKGGDEGLKTQLESVKAELTSTKAQYNELNEAFEKAKSDHLTEIDNIRIADEVARAKEGFNFKKGFSDAVMKTLIGQATANVMAKHPSFEDRDGVKVLIFHDENGAPLNNAGNKLNPFTARELLEKEFEGMDILEKQSARGAGGKQTTGEGRNGLGAFATQEEAGEAISKFLALQGVPKTSLKYREKYDALWEENKCSELPLT